MSPVEDYYEEIVILRALDGGDPGAAEDDDYYLSYEIHYARPGEAEAFTDLEHSFFAAGEALEREAEEAFARRRAAG